MGWGRTLLLGDIGNRLDIEDTEREIARLKRDISGSSHKDKTRDKQINNLITENAELKLYLVAVIRLLKSKDIIAAEELLEMVNAVDGEDGSADGKYTGSVV
jgi:hypothetical protein